MTDPTPFAVLVVDDDPDTRANLRDILDLDGYAVDEAGKRMPPSSATTPWPPSKGCERRRPPMREAS